MEMSHRGKEFIAIAAKAEADLRDAAGDSGQLQGAVPAGRRDRRERDRADEPAARQDRRRLRQHRRVVEEVDQGSEEVLQGQRRRVAPRTGTSPTSRRATTWKLDPNAAYVHICTNETIGGVEYHWTPDTGDVPLVADMSSHILSRPVDVAKYGVIYGGAQKNIGPAGLTHRDRARRPARPRAADHAVGVRLEGAGRQRLDAQHAADLRDLHRRPGVRVAAGAGRRWRRSSARTSPRRRCSTTTSTQSPFYTQPGRTRGPLADERAVQAARRGARRRVPQGREGARHGAAQGPPRRSAACARRSTTRCRSRACRRWSPT